MSRASEYIYYQVCTTFFLFTFRVSMVTPDGGFVTGGEDRTLRVWGPEGECVQTIHVPAQSVWAVASLPNLDIVCGSR